MYILIDLSLEYMRCDRFHTFQYGNWITKQNCIESVIINPLQESSIIINSFIDCIPHFLLILLLWLCVAHRKLIS